MNTKKLVAAVALVGAITVGTAGLAYAADGTSTSPGNATSQNLRGHPRIRAAVRRGAFRVVIKTLGVTPDQLRTALKGGQSISEYTTSLGKDPQTVVDALVKAADTKLDKLAANGRITQERADTLRSKVPDRVNTFVNRHFGQHTADQTQS